MSEEKPRSLKELWDAFAARYEIETNHTDFRKRDTEETLYVEAKVSGFTASFDSEKHLKNSLDEYGLSQIEVYDTLGQLSRFLLGRSPEDI